MCKPASLIGTIIGSGLLLVLLTVCLLFCHRFIKNKTKRQVISANVNSNTGAAYEEIDEFALHTMPSGRQNVEQFNRRPETSLVSSISQPVHRQLGVSNRLNDYLVPISAGIRHEDIHTDTADNDESSSNTTKSSNKTGNSYININANVLTSYQSLVRDTFEEYDTNSYDELSEDLNTNTHYINLHV